MSDVPSYPREASEREEAALPESTAPKPAGWWARAGAYLLDSLLLFVPLLVVLVLVFAANPEDDSGAWTLLGILYLATLALPFVYFTVMHGGRRGQTYGKSALGIRVVDERGGPIGYGRAFGRYAITFVMGLLVVPILLDYLWPLWDERGQALHDKTVGSIVVRASGDG